MPCCGSSTASCANFIIAILDAMIVASIIICALVGGLILAISLLALLGILVVVRADNKIMPKMQAI